MSITRRASAEFLGTFWLVLGGCGAAVLAAKFQATRRRLSSALDYWVCRWRLV